MAGYDGVGEDGYLGQVMMHLAGAGLLEVAVPMS